MPSLGKLAEYERGGAQAEGKSQVDVQLIVPGHSEEVAIVSVDGDQAIGLADVDFSEQRFTTFLHDESDGVVHAGVR